MSRRMVMRMQARVRGESFLAGAIGLLFYEAAR
jgi:hypothetical protein